MLRRNHMFVIIAPLEFGFLRGVHVELLFLGYVASHETQALKLVSW
jgi:hypothetical protein